MTKPSLPETSQLVKYAHMPPRTARIGLGE